jgi:hypothetical protein
MTPAAGGKEVTAMGSSLEWRPRILGFVCHW